MVNISKPGGHQGAFSATEEDDDGNAVLLQRDPASNSLMDQPNIASFYSADETVRRAPTLCIAVLQLVILVALEISAFIFSDVLHLLLFGGVDPPFAFLTVVHVGVWLIILVFDRYFYFHHRSLRRDGYLALYTNTKELRRIPFLLFCFGNAVLLVIVSILGNVHLKSGFTLVRVFQVVCTIEVLGAMVATSVYIVKIVKFNETRCLPDACHQDALEDGFSSANYNAPEVGFRDPQQIDDILEKQAEMIRYLQHHNKNLGQRILTLTHQSNSQNY